MSSPGDLLPLTPGRLYRVRRSFTGWPRVLFVQGETLRFTRTAYSRYDDAYLYTFQTATGEEKAWAPLQDAEREWEEGFEPAAEDV